MIRKILHSKTYILLLIIITISLIIYWRWLFYSTFQSSDWGFFYSEKVKEIFTSYLWISNTNFGGIDFSIWRLPLSLIYNLFGYLGFNSNLADKLLVFIPIIFLSGLVSFLLVKKVTNSNFAGFVGSFVFSYNTYFLSINTQGHELLTVSFIFSTLTIWLFMISLERKTIFLSLITGLCLFIASFYDFRGFYITAWILFFYFLYFVFFINRNYSFKTIVKILAYAGIPILITLLVNLYWLWPFSNIKALVDNDVLSRGLFGNQFWNLSEAITLFHPFWNGKEPIWFSINRIPYFFWLIPIFAFSGLLLNIKNKNVIFFGFLAIIGIFLAKQVGEPFGNFYYWLYNNLPGFNAFREASKFYFLIILGYSVLIGSFVSWLKNKWAKRSWQMYCTFFLAVLVIVIFLWNTKSIIDGEIKTMFIPRNIPNDYLVFKNFILDQRGEHFKILWIPRPSRWGYYDDIHPRAEINVFDLGRSDFKDFIKNDESAPANEKMVSLFTQSFSDSLLNVSNIKYIVVPTKDTSNDDDFFPQYFSDRQFYLDKLDSLEYLRKIEIGTAELAIYENENYQPVIFIPDNILFINGTDHIINDYNNLSEKNPQKNFIFVDKKENNTTSDSFTGQKPQDMTFEITSPTKKSIHIKSASDPFFLILGEKYNPGWKLLADDKKVNGFLKNWWPFTKPDIISDNQHFAANNLLNSWYIDPAKLAEDNLAKQNLDGSYDIEIIGEFWPQRLFIFWSIISGAILLSIIVVICFIWKRPRHSYRQITPAKSLDIKRRPSKKHLHPDWI